MKNNGIQKIIDNYFSSNKVISHYSRPRLHIGERILFKKYLKGTGRILDLFCGAGRISFVLAKRGFKVVGVDSNRKMIEKAKELQRKNKIRIKFICEDASAINFSNRFDYVLVMENSLELVPSKYKREIIMKKIYKALKKDGLFITSFHSCFLPKKMFLRLMHQNIKNCINKLFINEYSLEFNDIFIVKKKIGKKIFFHIFTPFEIKKLIKRAGFSLYESFSSKSLTARKRIKNSFYFYFKPFFYCYYIIKK